ncbi:hypothetical protein AQ436_15735 [Arthrobacter sp. EpRS66]|nr:hypothetical protein AQ436_15735 [Arthrobacter sp. EpRS66]
MAMKQAEDIAAGKGLTGKLVKGLMGKDNAARFGSAVDAARHAQLGAQLQAQSLPQIGATVTALVDTGKLVNFDPVVDLQARCDDGRTVQLQVVVSKLQVPQVGDRINLMANPSNPSEYLYAGLAR